VIVSVDKSKFWLICKAEHGAGEIRKQVEATREKFDDESRVNSTTAKHDITENTSSANLKQCVFSLYRLSYRFWKYNRNTEQC